MQYAGIDMAEHAVAQAVAVEQRAELDDIIRQMFRRYAGVFRKRNRLGRPFGVTQQTDRFFTHRIDPLDAREVVAQLPANHAAFTRGDQFIETVA